MRFLRSTHQIHLVTNEKGHLHAVKFTKGNVDDRVPVPQLVKNLTGWLFGDKGYLSQKLSNALAQRGLELFTRVRKNMKQKLLKPAQKVYLDKRSMIETIIDQLKAICHIQHTRHRSSTNFVVNLLAGLVAYVLKPNKVTVKFNNLNNLNTLLMPN